MSKTYLKKDEGIPPPLPPLVLFIPLENNLIASRFLFFEKLLKKKML
jgi:hypothetical protein